MRSDAELLAAWQTGSISAGNELFDRYYAAIERFFRNKCENAFEDLVQRTFMACVEGKERFRGDSSFRTYLFGIAHNVLREHLRRLAGPQGRVDFATSSIQDFAKSISSLLHGREEHARLLANLRRLAVDDQIVLELYYWEGLSASELAAVIRSAENVEFTEAGARNRLRRAKERLAERFVTDHATAANLEDVIARIEEWAAEVRCQMVERVQESGQDFAALGKLTVVS